MDNSDRRIEISNKLFKMGEMLVNEGFQSGDDNIARCGNFIIFNSAIIFNDKESLFMDEICTTISQKKLIEDSNIYDKIKTLSSGDLMLLINNLKNK